jgi:hypothetical protein
MRTHRPAEPADDPIADAAEEVVDIWRDAGPGKDPSVTPDDLTRMRDGFAEVADEAARGGDEPA